MRPRYHKSSAFRGRRGRRRRGPAPGLCAALAAVLLVLAGAGSSAAQESWQRARVILTSGSDTADLRLVSGGRIVHAVFELQSGDPADVRVAFEDGRLHLGQSTFNAILGRTMSARFDLILAGLEPGAAVTWELERSYPRSVRAELFNFNQILPLQLTALDGPGSYSLAADPFRSGGPIGPPAPAAPPKLLAFYYPWYELAHWNSPMMADGPEPPYASGQRKTMRRHLAWSEMAGIDALISSWWGSGDATDVRFARLLDEARSTAVQLTIYFETLGARFASPAQIVEQLEYVLSTYSPSPAFLRHQGRPVIFLYAAEAVPRESGFSALETWSAIRARLAADGFDPILIGDTLDPAYLAVFDGLHSYAAGVVLPVDALAAIYAAVGERVRADHLLRGPGAARKLWLPGILPGYDDRLLGRPSPIVVPRAGGAAYAATFAAAAASAPDWITITSFNEWWENSQIEPGVNHGGAELHRTREWRYRLAQPASAALPLLVATTDEGSYQAGDRWRLLLSASNEGPARSVDLLLGVYLADGRFLLFENGLARAVDADPNDPGTFVPVVHQVTLSAGLRTAPETLLELTLPNLPPGLGYVVSGVYQAGSLGTPNPVPLAPLLATPFRIK
ncbi:MAG TPA: hypothetical protein VGB99_17760 [Acidobacteriota bacterium]